LGTGAEVCLVFTFNLNNLVSVKSLKKYLSLVKFSHTIFAMPFALIGFFLGLSKIYNNTIQEASNGLVAVNLSSTISTRSIVVLLLLVILCMVFARSAAMAFNRFLDSHFDARNPRTAIREIPAGIISKESALRFVVINCLLFIVVTFFINRICFALSPVALFVILFYSYTKRFTALCHLVLGVGLSLAPIGAYLSVTGKFDLLPILFSFAVLFWVSGFDIIYALQDEEFDRSQQLHSMPAKFGKVQALKISTMIHMLAATCIMYAGYYGNFGIWYWSGTVVFTGMLIYQHSIIEPNDLKRVNIAFMTANGIASVVFAIFVITDIFLSK
jgi:4-hydroxybenzoate polyprenyltransferase